MEPISGSNKLCGGYPRIIIDTREQTPLTFATFPTVVGTLPLGDYSIVGGENEFAIERKSIADLCSCVTGERERFERELTRMRGHQFSALVIVGTQAEIAAHNYRSAVEPAAVLASLMSWAVRFRCGPYFFATPAEAAAQIETWAWYYAHRVRCAAKCVELVTA
jgi:ERCC4-type nuclease